MTDAAEFVFNGVDGLTGQPLLAPMSADALADLVLRAPIDRPPALPDDPSAFGLGFDLDPTRLEDAGWTIVFAADAAQEVRDALAPLIAHREACGAAVNVLQAEVGEDFAAFMARHGVHPGEVEPDKIGLYLLIVGSPAQIDWSFQHHADIEYAVGRLDLDAAEDYARYASSVIAAETGAAEACARSLSVWGPRHDRATALSHDELLLPLLDGEPATATSRAQVALTERLKWSASRRLGADATKAGLLEALGERPALLLAACHGVGGFAPGSPRQLAEQGALLSADWGGPGAVGPGDYVGAADIGDALELGGTIAFVFACYGAGTPTHDCFRHRDGSEPARLAESGFTAALAKRLLAHPKGSALALIGHVDRAWGTSFIDASGRHLGPFRSALGNLMLGRPVGFAVAGFNERYAVLSSQVASLLEQQGFGREVDRRKLSRAWLERNDAQNYVVLGDPAVRASAAKA